MTLTTIHPSIDRSIDRSVYVIETKAKEAKKVSRDFFHHNIKEQNSTHTPNNHHSYLADVFYAFGLFRYFFNLTLASVSGIAAAVFRKGFDTARSLFLLSSPFDHEDILDKIMVTSYFKRRAEKG